MIDWEIKKKIEKIEQFENKKCLKCER